MKLQALSCSSRSSPCALANTSCQHVTQPQSLTHPKVTSSWRRATFRQRWAAVQRKCSPRTIATGSATAPWPGQSTKDPDPWPTARSLSTTTSCNIVALRGVSQLYYSNQFKSKCVPQTGNGTAPSPASTSPLDPWLFGLQIEKWIGIGTSVVVTVILVAGLVVVCYLYYKQR